MIRLVPARTEMLFEMAVQPAQAAACAKANIPAVREAIERGPAWGAYVGERLLVIGGAVPQGPGRAVVWSVLSESIRDSMVTVHRAVAHTLDVLGYDRLEAHVAADHLEGRRWARMLGFEMEGRMKKFHAGRDYLLFARVR